MDMYKKWILFGLIVGLTRLAGFSQGQGSPEQVKQRILSQVGRETPTDSTRVHDPVMIQGDDGRFYLFTTGWGVSVFSSSDRKTWRSEKPIFLDPPAWAKDTVPGYNGHTWAPDVAFHNGRFLVYYSVSTFGKNRSAIGVVSNGTLNPNHANYEWIDHGPVVISQPGITNWNAIDANFILDENGEPYLSFGSFWGGLQLVKLSPDGLRAAEKNPHFQTICTRNTSENAVEAPFIFRKDGWFYLFASFDFCCRGAESTYKVVVGRSQKLAGPYLDAQGQLLIEGGGTLVVEGNSRYAGVGHNAVVHFDGTDYLIFHAYDMQRKGASFLRILPINWENGWPVVSAEF
jgi:arabinan endo-1,5-alpha-L-arabinosidase